MEAVALRFIPSNITSWFILVLGLFNLPVLQVDFQHVNLKRDRNRMCLLFGPFYAFIKTACGRYCRFVKEHLISKEYFVYIFLYIQNFYDRFLILAIVNKNYCLTQFGEVTI